MSRVNKKPSNQLIHNDRPDPSQLFDRYAPALFGIILKMTKSQVQAERILQQTFLQVSEQFEFFDPKKTSVFIWMFRIARATAKEYKQSADNEGVRSKNGSSSAGKQINSKKPMANLAYKDQAVFNLIFLEGLSLKETSDQLGLPCEAVKKILHTSMNVIRKSEIGNSSSSQPVNDFKSS